MNVARILDRGMQLQELLADVVPLPVDFDACITDLVIDSRRAGKGSVFLACKGQRHDGRDHIDEAIGRGASAVLTEAEDDTGFVSLYKGVPLVPVYRLPALIGQIAARFYGYPANHLWLVGITGTNGKTSTCQFIAQWYQALGQKCGVSGTLGSGICGDLQENSEGTPGTTPDAAALQALYSDVVSKGAGVMAMEVSSHGLVQQRVNVDEYAVAVFTNLSRDHLDYHGSMDAYGRAKKVLFSGRNLKAAVVNLDDDFSNEIIRQLSPDVRTFTYSLARPEATLYARSIEHHGTGMRIDVVTPWGEITLNTHLIGSFNAANLLAAMAAVLAGESRKPGFDFQLIASMAEGLMPVSGRMQIIGNGRPAVIVDYAHTPDAMQTALQAVHEHCSGKIWCVFGCGGNRDSGKRPLMGKVAARYATKIVVTDDNPRDESSAKIIAEIVVGFPEDAVFKVIPDRASAIDWAIHYAADDDVVLLAGKGHENYQYIKGERLAFSDVIKARLSLQKRNADREGAA